MTVSHYTLCVSLVKASLAASFMRYYYSAGQKVKCARAVGTICSSFSLALVAVENFSRAKDEKRCGAASR